MSEWQPIETAPKDGTSIIGYEPDFGVGECFWFGSWYGDKSGACWMPAKLDEEYGGPVNLTHWQPLP